MIYETIRVSSKGQITLPKRMRDEQHIGEGDTLVVVADKKKIMITKPERPESDDEKAYMTMASKSMKSLWDNPEDDIWNSV